MLQLETSRLLVRPFRESDAEALHAVLSDPAVMRWIEPPFTEEQTRTFIRENGLCRPARVYAVTLKESGELIGQLIWHPWDGTATELGWILRRDHWGRGFVGELTDALLMQTERDIVIECSSEQTATRYIAESRGFVLSGENDGLLVYRHTRKS